MKAFNVKIRKFRKPIEDEGNPDTVLPTSVEVNGKHTKFLTRHCRSIFRFEDKVIKIEDGFDYRTAEATFSEFAAFQSFTELSFLSGHLKKEHRKYFVPIIGTGITTTQGYVFIYIIQKFVRGGSYKWNDERKNELWDIIDEYLLDDVATEFNAKIDHKGQVKIFDYAI